ncbi:sensor histidine kinase [Paenibacillus sp. GCM10023252]|uniref:sensor histidine kinase n=1 Tax=Paenibacillus sp. GCM10023252 TaxID=3252649 RepID=UPI0036068636
MKLVRPASLRSQLLARSLLVLAALLLLIGLLQYAVTKSYLYDNEAEAMVVQLMTLPKDLLIPRPDSQGTMRRVGRELPYLFMPGTSLAVVSSNGELIDLARSGGLAAPQLSKEKYAELRTGYRAVNPARPARPGPVSPDLPPADGPPNHRSSGANYHIASNADGVEQLVIWKAIGPSGSGEWLQMGRDLTPLHSVLRQQLLTFAGLSLLSLGAGAALYLPLLRRTLVPLTNMVTLVRRIDAGKLDQRLPADAGQLEIDQLSNSFNTMLERLQASFDAEREAAERMRIFVADASHELRTPMTSIHGFLEVLLRGAASNPAQLQGALRSMYGESTRMNKLIEDLLLLAKLDRDPQLEGRRLSLGELLRDMQPQLQLLAGERTVRIDLPEGGVDGSWDGDKLKQVILNLFLNAVQHTSPTGGHIGIRLGRSGVSMKVLGDSFAEISIEDNGTGIAEEHLPRLFERFYRSDAARTRIQGGAGLGLAISKAIVEAHGGTIEVSSTLGIGSTFTIKLPIVEQI